MRHRIVGALAALATLGLTVATVAPATAHTETSTVTTAAAAAETATKVNTVETSTVATVATAPTAVRYVDDPMINGRKFATSSICVGSTANQTTYPTGAAAQQWNVQSGSGGVLLDASTSCTTDGYGPSARMVVGTFNNPAEGCLYFTNLQTSTLNGYERWTNGPGVYLNTADSFCVGTLARRQHWLSEGEGYLLGLINFGSAGWNSHVMNETTYSVDNIHWATGGEGDKVWAIYNGLFCDVGSVC